MPGDRAAALSILAVAGLITITQEASYLLGNCKDTFASFKHCALHGNCRYSAFLLVPLTPHFGTVPQLTFPYRASLLHKRGVPA